MAQMKEQIKIPEKELNRMEVSNILDAEFKTLVIGFPTKMEAWVDTPCLLAQPKEGQQQFKNKNQPKLTENQTVWKSDHQGDKETFIQIGRRGREESREGGSWWDEGGGRLQSGTGKAVAGR